MEISKKPPTRAVTYVRPPFERLLDTQEAAALLRIHPKTLQRMARRGQLRAFQLGKLWRFRESDLVACVSAGIAS